MAVNFTETDRNEVEINIVDVPLAWFLQKLVPLVVESYLRKRIAQGLASISSGHSHWIEHVFLPRALHVYGDGSFEDDLLFNPRMLAQLEKRVNDNFITQSLADNFIIGLIGRNFVLRFSKDKKSIIIFFSETHKGVDNSLQDVLKMVLREKM